MKKILLALVFVLVCVPKNSTAQWLFDQNAVFVSVDGKVTVTDTRGTTRLAEKDSEAYEGETVKTAESSKAVLRFFDGSTLGLNADTQLVISSLKHPADKQKEIHFTLMAGWVLARVQKLMTASSLFEIEAGGVVCGVRGTQFSVSYEPAQESIDLKVIEGTVYAKAGGKVHLLRGGEEIEFNHGQPNSRVYQDMKSASREMRGKDSDLKVAETLPLGLLDLNSQFMLSLSVNGSRLAANPIVPSASVQSTISLSGIGGPSLLNGLPLLNTTQLNSIHLKLP